MEGMWRGGTGAYGTQASAWLGWAEVQGYEGGRGL